MPVSVFSTRARIKAAQADKLLKAYARRCTPKEAADATGLSLNTLYNQYERIRWRLVAAGYYRDGALSPDEAGLAPAVTKALRQRKGIREGELYPHAAEAIFWADEHPPALALKHLRKIIELTGPLDQPSALTEAEFEKLIAYVRYARTELVYERAKESAARDAAMSDYRDRAKVALDIEWNAYRAASRKVERTAPRPRNRRRRKPAT